MLYDLSMSERIVYVIQEIAGTKAGNPKINIMGASSYGKFKFLLPLMLVRLCFKFIIHLSIDIYI